MSNTTSAQSGQKFASGGNILSTGEFFGTLNNYPIDVKVNNTLRSSFTTTGFDVFGNIHSFGNTSIDSLLTTRQAIVDHSLTVIGNTFFGNTVEAKDNIKIIFNPGVSLVHSKSTASITFDALGYKNVIGLGYNTGSPGKGQNLFIAPTGALGNKYGIISLLDEDYKGKIEIGLGTISKGTYVVLDGDVGKITLKNDGGDLLEMGGINGQSEWISPKGLKFNGNIKVYGDVYSNNFSWLQGIVSNHNLMLYDHQSAIDSLQLKTGNQQTAIDSLQSSITNIGSTIVSSQWQADTITSGNIFYNGGKVGIGTSAPAAKLDIYGSQRITGNLFVGGEVNVSEKFSAQTVEVDTANASRQLNVNHNLVLGKDTLSSGSDIASKVEALTIQSGTTSVYDVVMSADNNTRVGIGDKNPTEKLSVEGNVKVSGDIVSAGNINANCVTTSCLNVSGQTSFDSLSVAHKIKTARIVPLDGDSLIHFGENSIVMNNAWNCIWGSNTPNSYFGTIKGIGLGEFPIANASSSIAVGVCTRVESNAARSIVIGSGVFNSIYDYSFLKNDIPNTLMIGFNSNIPTLTVRESNGVGTTGNVGIGTKVPTRQLHISGADPAIRFEDNEIESGTSELANFIISAGNGAARLISDQSVSIFINGDNNEDNRYFSVMDNGNFFGGTATTLFRVNENGNVGIGVENPSYKLDVCGTVRAKEVRVNLAAGGCDFVFEKDYQLLPLNELENYLIKNKHLPGIAPAKEMETENGIEVGVMQTQLLQKVEELTLYIIDLSRQNREQNKKIEQLQKEMELLKK